MAKAGRVDRQFGVKVAFAKHGDNFVMVLEQSSG
jgi:hypothetical protein